MSTSRPGFRQVRFAQFNHLAVIPNDSIESKAYSTADMARFKRDMIRDVRNMARVLANTPAGMVTEEDQTKCMGMELFLNRDLAREAHAKKTNHFNAIITGQHIYKSDELAQLSEICSSWSRVWAVQCAVGYSALPHEFESTD